MGCHTNFYIPANLTYEQARKLAVISLNKILEVWTVENIIYSGEYQLEDEWTEDTVIKRRDRLNRWLKRVQSNNPFWKASAYLIIDQYVTEYYLKRNKLFFQIEHFADCFRVGWDLGDRQLTSLQETLEFCTTYKDRINFCRNTWLEEVNLFWELYPEGIIDLG